jgi:hypothetical protein
MCLFINVKCKYLCDERGRDDDMDYELDWIGLEKGRKAIYSSIRGFIMAPSYMPY